MVSYVSLQLREMEIRLGIATIIGMSNIKGEGANPRTGAW